MPCLKCECVPIPGRRICPECLTYALDPFTDEEMNEINRNLLFSSLEDSDVELVLEVEDENILETVGDNESQTKRSESCAID